MEEAGIDDARFYAETARAQGSVWHVGRQREHTGGRLASCSAGASPFGDRDFADILDRFTIERRRKPKRERRPGAETGLGNVADFLAREDEAMQNYQAETVNRPAKTERTGP